MITHSELRRLLFYDPTTGLFTWKIHVSSTATAGKIAGTLSRGYLYIRIYGKGYRAGRLAWFYVKGSWPTHEIDHWDKDKLNNRFHNLRDVTSKINCDNRDQLFFNTEEYRQKQSIASRRQWARRKSQNANLHE